jgi:arylsulfatase A-like enzyme
MAQKVYLNRKKIRFNVKHIGCNHLIFACLILLVLNANQLLAQKPNIVFVLVDEWRAQDVRYAGNKDVITPNLDKLANEGLVFTNAVSVCPVCSPYRDSFLTGQYPLKHGVFVNDVRLNPNALTLSEILSENNYSTAYIGKWHLDGNDRNSFIPIERRQGFEYWKVLECTHDYWNSKYWDNDDMLKTWEGYDAFAQTNDAVKYIQDYKSQNPFFMIISLGPPHTPFQQAPDEFKKMYEEKVISIRKNVPDDLIEQATKELIGYYGHITALDKCVGELQEAIKNKGIDKNTIFIFTSDHGAMVQSHGLQHKQVPYDESILVPFVLKYPRLLGSEHRKTDILIGTPDIMPTLLGLCNIRIPNSVQGINYAPVLLGNKKFNTNVALIACYHPFGQWPPVKGGKEYRGIRTENFTYVKDLNGPWLLFDNSKDTFQMNNLVNNPDYSAAQKELDRKLKSLLKETNDDFRPSSFYISKWNYEVDKNGTVPYNKRKFEGSPVYPVPEPK